MRATRSGKNSRPSRVPGTTTLAAWLAIAGLLTAVVPAQVASGDEAPATSPPAASTGVESISSLSGPALETIVAGLTIQGRTRFERIVIQDLDILYTDDDERFLPLMRILQALKVDVADSDGTLSFQLDGGPQVELEYVEDRASVDGEAVDVEAEAGVSDLTNQGELYVHENSVSGLLGLEMTWDPSRYEYTLATDRKLAVFERDRSGLLSARRQARSFSFDLPGNLPPAQIDRSIIPRPDFLRLRTNSSLIAREDEEDLTGTFSPPRVELWGQALAGRTYLALSQKETDPSEGVRIDRASWRSYFGSVEAEFGTSGLGLSELAFPSINLVGLRLNGLLGSTGVETSQDPTRMGRRQSYQPTHVIEGRAPLGSEVKLEVNGTEIDAMIVEDPEGSPPGEGVYRFEGVNLFSSRLNEVRVVVTTPDGVVEESTREILGTNLLADRGQMTFIAAGGGRRLAASDGISRQGDFVGARISYGLLESMTIGATAGFQEDLYEEDALRYGGETVIDTIPRASRHLGSRLVWKPFDPLMLVVGAARSELTDTSETDWAYTAGGELHVGSIRFYPTLYRYGSSFFNGSDADLADVRGAAGSVVWRPPSGNEVALGASRSYDNLDGSRDRTTELQDAAGSIRLRNVIPRSSLTLGSNLVWVDEGEPLRYDVIGFDTNLLGSWLCRNRFVLGDDVRERLRSDLPEGAFSRFDRIRQQASRYDARSSLGSSALASKSELRRRFGRLWRLSLSHYSSTTTERSTVDLVRNAPFGGHWQWRLTPGYDWRDETFFLQNRIEYLIGGSRQTRGIFEVQYRDERWLARISLQIQLDVGFADNMPVLLGDSRVNPDVGGVRGRVFVDFNGNGLRDSGEPGLADVDVMTAQGKGVKSRSRGLFLIPNNSYRRGDTISLDPQTLPAIYTPTQATQEAVLRPGMFTEINLGVGAFGAISGYVRGKIEDGTLTGVPSLRVVLVDEQGQVVKDSFTAGDGSYYLGEVKPGSYTVRVDETGLPEGFQLEVGQASVDVFPDTEFYEIEDMDFIGTLSKAEEGTAEEEAEPEAEEDAIRYKVFD